MNVLNLKRGAGKTTALIYVSALTGYRIITFSSRAANDVKYKALELGMDIPKPMSYKEYHDFVRSNRNGEDMILIDELSFIADRICEEYFGVPIMGATITDTMLERKQFEELLK